MKILETPWFGIHLNQHRSKFDNDDIRVYDRDTWEYVISGGYSEAHEPKSDGDMLVVHHRPGTIHRMRAGSRSMPYVDTERTLTLVFTGRAK